MTFYNGVFGTVTFVSCCVLFLAFPFYTSCVFRIASSFLLFSIINSNFLSQKNNSRWSSIFKVFGNQGLAKHTVYIDHTLVVSHNLVASEISPGKLNFCFTSTILFKRKVS